MKSAIKFIPGNRAGIAVNPEKDGIIEVRPGTKGINLGERKYAMAYIRVLNEHKYLKGMDGKPFKFKGIYKSSEKYDIGDICVFSENDKALIIFLGGDRGWRQLPKV